MQNSINIKTGLRPWYSTRTSSVQFSQAPRAVQAAPAVSATRVAPKPEKPAARRRWKISWQQVAGPAFVAVFCLSLWQAQKYREIATDSSLVRTTLAQLAESNRARAHAAFEAGSFQDALAFLDPVALRQSDDLDLQVMYARSLEALGDFRPASVAYEDVLKHENHPGFARGAHMFCQRMSTDRTPGGRPSREVNYRLVEELMRRDQAATARFVARRLTPDLEPLRMTVGKLLKEADLGSRLTLRTDKSTVDVSITKVDGGIIDLLKDLKIGTLSIADARLRETKMLAGLDLQSLNLAMNPLVDLAGLSALHIRSLDLSGTDVADVRSLAPVQLRDLDLSHTNVSSLYPLALCPLETLNIASTAIHDFTPLRGLALRRLDVSRTRFDNLALISSLPIDELHLDGAQVTDLRPLAGMKLRVLTLSATAVKDLSPLADMPLVEIDLRGCPNITDVSVLASCKQLERISLPGRLQPPNEVAQMPKLKTINYERPRFEAPKLTATLRY